MGIVAGRWSPEGAAPRAQPGRRPRAPVAAGGSGATARVVRVRAHDVAVVPLLLLLVAEDRVRLADLGEALVRAGVVAVDVRVRLARQGVVLLLYLGFGRRRRQFERFIVCSLGGRRRGAEESGVGTRDGLEGGLVVRWVCQCT